MRFLFLFQSIWELRNHAIYIPVRQVLYVWIIVTLHTLVIHVIKLSYAYL